MEETKPCKICAKPIPFAARKCTECDSFQDWRGSLSISSAVLSLLVALVSVSTAAIPVVKDAFERKNFSEIQGTIQHVQEGEVTLLFSNLGDRPGSISAILIGHKSQATDDSFLEVGRLSNTKNGSNLNNGLIVKPGESLSVPLSFNASVQSDDLHKALSEDNPFCFMQLLKIEFSQDLSESDTKIDCSMLYIMMMRPEVEQEPVPASPARRPPN